MTTIICQTEAAKVNLFRIFILSQNNPLFGCKNNKNNVCKCKKLHLYL